MQNKLTIKLGDTFAVVASIKDSVGQPLIGIADKLKSQVRDQAGKLYSTLDISEPEPGQYMMRADTIAINGDGIDWALGNLYMDIQYTDGDIVTSSDTIGILVIKDVTK